MTERKQFEAPPHSYLVEADAAGRAVAGYLREPVVALDTETFWDPKANGSRVSLVQLAAAADGVAVIDVLATGVEVVRPLVESAGVQKIAHNAGFDQMVLAGEGLKPANFVDTLRLARSALTLYSYSLANVSEHLFGERLDKRLQKSNWRRRPLSGEQIGYAATDAHVTLRVFVELRRRLEGEGRWEQAVSAATLHASTDRPPRKKRTYPPLSPPLSPAEKRAVRHLKQWRLALAQARHVPAYMICPDRTLEHLVRARPATLEALGETYGLGPSKVESFGRELLEALRETPGLKPES